MASSIQSLLQASHILVLLQIYPIIRKENIETVQIEPHGGLERPDNLGAKIFVPMDFKLILILIFVLKSSLSICRVRDGLYEGVWSNLHSL